MFLITFFALDDFGIDAPGTPQKAPLGLDEAADFEGTPKVGKSCCLGAGPLFLC